MVCLFAGYYNEDFYIKRNLILNIYKNQSTNLSQVKKCHSVSWICAIPEAFLTTVIKFHITYSCISYGSIRWKENFLKINKIRNTEKLYKPTQIFHGNLIFLWSKWNILDLSPLFLFLNFTPFPCKIRKFKLHRFNMYLNYIMTLWNITNHCNSWDCLCVMCYLFIIISIGPFFLLDANIFLLRKYT